MMSNKNIPNNKIKKKTISDANLYENPEQQLYMSLRCVAQVCNLQSCCLQLSAPFLGKCCSAWLDDWFQVCQVVGEIS